MLTTTRGPHDRPTPLEAMRQVTIAAGVPYGFTLSIWAGGTLAVADLGLPSRWEAMLFVAGAVVAFIALEVLAHGGWRPLATSMAPAPVWAHAHFVSAGAAALLVDAAVGLPLGAARWAVAGATATAGYLALTAAAVCLASRR